MGVFRAYTERREGFALEAEALRQDLREALRAEIPSLRIFNRYDLEGVEREVYEAAKAGVLARAQTDVCYDEELPEIPGGHTVFAVEPLPGQYDQRADSLAQCIQMMTRAERPACAAAKVYVFGAEVPEALLGRIKEYIINPVESREASLEKPATLAREYALPTKVETLEGFRSLDDAGLEELLEAKGLAMDIADLKFFQSYFTEEGRDPTITELRVVDTYWSDHCRHTTFGTELRNIVIDDERVRAAFDQYLKERAEARGEAEAAARPITLMDIATAAAKVLKKRGVLKDLDESEEINACSVKVRATVDGEEQDWILMFKNETHNHPTEIEPFGGAATCLGGAIRDPLSGRSYVYQAMRVTGAGDPTVPASETIPGKLPQRKLTVTAAQGYSSYGNQIGLATGFVDELYHPGYVAKRLEIGAVVGAAPAENIRRERPAPGDLVILLGGRTGRDGIGGATGSSKSHTAKSLETCAAEVQKGNPPEERKLQRLFRSKEAAAMIKRCNDFGAGGVSVAIGELADGLVIELDRVPRKYEGLDGTELAISESQERMAVVVAPEDAERFAALAARENLESTVVAAVTEEPRLRMNWNGKTIVDISRSFLDTNGAKRSAEVHVLPAEKLPESICGLRELARSLPVASKRGLVERFDGTIGAGSVLMPYGGAAQRTPAQSMAALLPAKGETSTCSVMAYGFDPYLTSADPFEGSQRAVIASVAKLVASGCDARRAYLTFQEYFERLRDDGARWGKPFAALLGAYTAQIGLGAAAIGGKDSMSGSFNELDVPPTLVSFAIAAADARDIITPEFKRAGENVYLVSTAETADFAAHLAAWDGVRSLMQTGKVTAAWAAGTGTVAEGIVKMSFGNRVGFAGETYFDGWYERFPAGLILVSPEELEYTKIGVTTEDGNVSLGGETVAISDLLREWEAPLEGVFPTRAEVAGEAPAADCREGSPVVRSGRAARPKAVIAAFPGTNCEEDTARAVERAGGAAEIVLVRNLTPAYLEESTAELERAIRSAQMLILPGGFSGGDEPDGSAKFIEALFRSPAISDAVAELLEKRDGLMLGICNGFQALVALGLLPYGRITPESPSAPTLTHNLIGRHQSRYVRTRVGTTKSPWLSKMQVGDVHAVPVSHGEGRFVAPKDVLDALLRNGQIAFQYADENGVPTMDAEFNPNGSMYAIEGIVSPDGRILGKMGHTERSGKWLARNIPLEKKQPVFEGGVAYFRD